MSDQNYRMNNSLEYIGKSDRWSIILQVLDILGEPFKKPFEIQLSINKIGNKIELFIPTFCTDIPETGGIIITVDKFLPEKYRPSTLIPVNWFVAKDLILNQTTQTNLAINSNSGCLGSIDINGRIGFRSSNNLPLSQSILLTLPSYICYLQENPVRLFIENLPLSLGSSNSAIYQVDHSSKLDFGDYDCLKNAFFNGISYQCWADNSNQLGDQQYQRVNKSYVLRKMLINKNGSVKKISKLKNLTNDQSLNKNYAYFNGSVAINPNNSKNIFVICSQHKESNIGFVLCRSFDRGKTWTRKILGTDSLAGGSCLRCAFDRFGGFWISYLHINDQTKVTSKYILIYSEDQGDNFTLIDNRPAPIDNSYQYGDLAIGPNYQNPEKNDALYLLTDLVSINPNQNDSSFKILGFQINGLGIININFIKEFIIDHSKGMRFGNVDIGPKGEVYIVGMKTVWPNLLPIYLDYPILLMVNKEGLKGEFNKVQKIGILTGAMIKIPSQPNRGISMMYSISVDKSHSNPGRIYLAFVNNQRGDDASFKPYLTWSDDQGANWIPPINLSDVRTKQSQFNISISIDHFTGNLAISWYDQRKHKCDIECQKRQHSKNCPNQNETDVKRYVTIIACQDLPIGGNFPIKFTHHYTSIKKNLLLL